MNRQREIEIRNLMKFARGEKIEKHYLRFRNEDGSTVPNLPDREIENPFDLTVEFVDYSGKKKVR